ncbi:MAG TPA: GNAT family N-acetyltransferase [Puia sp.]|nr:GNAT family N-acetyltransferase [Puia sp.]
MEDFLHRNGKVYRLRAAGGEDREEIVRLVRSILPEFGEVYDEQRSESDLVDIGKTYEEPGGIFLVLVGDDQHIIGTAGLIPLGAGCCKLRKMYIDGGHRKLGLGQLLLDTIFKKAKALRFSKIMLETITSMEAAIAMYEKSGFRRIGRQTASSRCDIPMEKEL